MEKDLSPEIPIKKRALRIALRILLVVSLLLFTFLLLPPLLKIFLPFILALIAAKLFLAPIIWENFKRFSWWDTVLHFGSGILFSMVCYLLFTSLNRDSGIRRRLNPFGVVLFAVCFSVTCGVMWEVFEFAADSILGMNMQRWRRDLPVEEWTSMLNNSNFSNPGLINTMKDIIADTVGLICSIAVLLPLVRHNNSYVKTQVSSLELLEESRQAFDGLRMGKASASVSVLRTQAQDTKS